MSAIRRSERAAGPTVLSGAPAAPGPPSVDAGSPRVLDPVVLVGGLAVVAAFAVALRLGGVSLHLAQQVTAGVLVLGFLGAVLRSPQNGLLLLFLLPPLFNGEDSRPYFFLLEIFVYLTLLGGLAERLWRRGSIAFPFAPFFALFLLSTVLSVPLNLGELWLQIRISPWPDLVEGLRRSDLSDNLFYVRTVLNVASGVALYVLAANGRWTRDLVVRLGVAATVLGGAVSLIGLFWLAFLPSSAFLTLRLDGRHGGAFSAVGFNTGYYTQYALAYLPLVVLVLVERAPAWAKAMASGVVLMTGYTILITYQRGAYLLLLVEIGLLVGAASCLRTPRGRSALVPVGSVAGGVLVLVAALLLVTPLGPTALQRFEELWRAGDPYRQHVLPVAWRMFLDQPLLGIGSGRFADVFQLYSAESGRYQWGSLSSHSLYAQLLAEQGALGLVSFLAILGLTVGSIRRGQRQSGEERPAVLFLLVSLGTWLTFGLLQYTFLMRSMQGYFWITLGLLVALTRPPAPAVRRLRWPVAVLLTLLVIAAGTRFHGAMTRPLRPDLALGVHAREPGDVRWTRGGAVFNLRVEGPTLRLPVACPIPQVRARPQTVTVLVDGHPVHRVTLDTPAWTVLEIPVSKPVGSTVLIGIRAGYTFVPAALGLNEDGRRLGVLTAPVTWTAAPVPAPRAPVAR